MTLRACAGLLALMISACDGGDPPVADGGHQHAHLDATMFDPNAYDGPALLSQTGLYDDFATRTLASDVASYEVAFPLWSDGSEKRRFLSLPAGTSIDTTAPDDWVFPVGTRVWKEFSVGGRAIETRFLRKLDAETWERVSFVWREDGSDADARPAGVIDALGTAHDVPDVAACVDCHRGGRDEVLGLSSTQLGPATMTETRAELLSRGWLTGDIAPSPLVATETEQAALGYLHGNCGHCHGPHHPLGRLRTMRLYLPYGLTTAANAPAVTTTVGAYMAHEFDGLRVGVVARNPSASQLWQRMRRRDAYRMPAIGSEVVDEDGVEVVRAWIAAMPSEP